MPSNNTFAEALPKLAVDVAKLKQVSDADAHMPFIVQMETLVLGYMRQPQQRAAQDGQMPAPPGPMAPSFQGTPGGGMGGVGMGAAPNTDELRRLLSAGG